MYRAFFICGSASSEKDLLIEETTNPLAPRNRTLIYFA